jgi:hypothetical protein
MLAEYATAVFLPIKLMLSSQFMRFSETWSEVCVMKFNIIFLSGFIPNLFQKLMILIGAD